MITIFMYNNGADIRVIQNYFPPGEKYFLVDSRVSEVLIECYIEEILKRCIAKGAEMLLLARTRDEYRFFRLSEVFYISSNSRKITIKGKDLKNGKENTIECYYNLCSLEEPLNCFGFCRVSGSFIISINHIFKIEKMMVYMLDGYVIPIGRQYYRTFVNRMMEYRRIVQVI